MKIRNKESRSTRSRRIGIVAGLFVAVIFGLFLLAGFYFTWASTFDLKEVGKIPERSLVYDMDGKVYSRLYGENRVLIDSDKVTPFFKQALLAREDTRFYQHHGIDPVGIFRACLSNLTHLSVREGGSTITQQLARNSFSLGGRNLSRKVLEAFLAFRIDSSYSKEQILGFYENRIYFGSGLYGLETASQAYFGKSASKLDLSEAALLAGLIRSPNRYSPITNYQGAIQQRNEVLDRMQELKMITPKQAAAAKNSTVRVQTRRPAVPQQNYAMEALYRELQGLVSQDEIDSGGLKVYTSLDQNLQRAAESIVEERLSQIEKQPHYDHPKKESYGADARVAEQQTDYLQGALLAIDNRSGGIRALVGGRDYRDSKFNRALQANRQVGSTFKPFVYAAAFARGMMPGAAISDTPLLKGEIESAPKWSPGNSDRTSRGTLPARDGLIFSRNIMTVRVGELATLDRVIQLGQSSEFAHSIPNYPASYLGAFESDLKDVTAAYSIFPNRGVRKEPYLIERIDDSEGKIIFQQHAAEKKVLSAAVAWLVTQSLHSVIERGTAASAKTLGLNRYAAGKTGTTDDYKDAWFVGFTNSLTCGVWVGFDQPKPVEERGYGATVALPIWVRFIENAARDKYPDGSFQSSEPLVNVRLCSLSNLIATDNCAAAGTAYAITLPQSLVPSRSCPVHGELEQPNSQTGPAEPPPSNQGDFGNRVMRSLRKLFGG
ncbi:MAG: PBP1A family penicillin-binding protein [Verrucomicrobia bacterium]|nr:PBP1A family penicillin-binding protein [Verrucomicrobiota bacterium]